MQKEVKDYIPEGLIFVAEDNPLWTQLEDGTIVTTPNRKYTSRTRREHRSRSNTNMG